MKTKRLGSEGPDLTVVGFGAWEAGGEDYGPNESADRVIDAIHAALDAGMNWIDTAEVYGGGTSEEIVGRAIEGRGDVLVASKVAPRPDGTGFRADEVRAACEMSLKRLGRDELDLYQLHWPADDGPPVEETWEAMARLVEDGLVRHVGVSNFGRGLIERCLSIRHVDSLQPEFSLLHLEERDLIRWCGERGIGVVAYGPLGFGLLTGKFDQDTAVDDWRSRGEVWNRLFEPGARRRSLAVTDALRPIARRLDATVAQVALAWTIHQEGATSAIAGSRNPEHCRTNAGAGDLALDEETLREIEEEILPLGPGV